MVAKQVFPIALTFALLAGCGGGNAATPTTPVASDGSAVSPVAPTDTSMIGGDPGGAIMDTSATGATLGGSGLTASPATSLAKGFILKGLVTDSLGKPLAGAKISIGSQTQLSTTTGTFSINGIMDTQITVNVTMDGYQSVSNYNVTFTTDSPSADKEFKLAPNTATSGTGTGTTTGTTPDTTTGTTTTGATTGFSLVTTLTPAKFSSVSAMVVDGGVVYILGIAKALIFSYNTVAELNTDSGEQIRSFNKTSFLTHIPKDATGLALVDGQVHVNNGTTTYVFGTDGTLVKKTAGGTVGTIRQITDTARKLTYKLTGGTKVEVTSPTGTTSYALPEASSAMAIGIDGKGDVLVLDGAKTAVLEYTFQP
jgi:hypothetical protein